MSREYLDKVEEVTQRLVRNKSYSGGEGDVVKELEKIFKEFNFDDYHIDEYGSIVGIMKGNKPGKKILFDAHIDTVPVDESQWSEDAFGGEIKDGKLYGRGASDMKGALASSICAVAQYAEDTNKDFAGELFVSGVVHEECFEGVGARSISEFAKPDYVIISEASELDLKIGQRGRAEIVVETFGIPAHSANPDKGSNAIYKAANVINRIKELDMTYDDDLGYGILELTDIKSSPYPGASVVPDYCKITYDRRLLVGETKESVIEPIQDLIDKMKKEDSEFDAKVSYAVGEEDCWTGNSIEGERFFPGWKYAEDADFVQAAYKGLKDAGLDSKITQYSFCTNGSHYAGEAKIKTIGFGPSRENLAHTVDEYVELDHLKKASLGNYHIIKELLK